MLPEFSSRSPFRAANWRWLRAQLAADGSLPLSRKRDDKWVVRATRFKRAFDLCNDKFDHALLEDQDPEVYWARSIFLAAEDINCPVRYAIEALLLADAPLEAIANRASTEVGVIEAYEALFYNVLDARRKGQRDWLMNKAIGPAVHRGLTAREYDLLWKLLAIQGGPFVIYRLLDKYYSSGEPTELSRTDGFLNDTIRSMGLSNALMAQATMQINGFTQVEIIKIHQSWVALEQSRGGGAGGAEATILSGVAAMMGALQLTVGPDKTGANPKLALADQRAAEPRYAEVLAYSAGQDYVVDPELETLRFPEPGK